MRIASSLILLFAAVIQIEAGCSNSRPSAVQSNEADASHVTDSLEIPLEAVAPAKPPFLDEGETCHGVLSISMPIPGSNGTPRRGCYPPGELDKAYTTGSAGPQPPPLGSAPTSEVTFESKPLESISVKDVEDIEEYVPEPENSKSGSRPAEE